MKQIKMSEFFTQESTLKKIQSLQEDLILALQLQDEISAEEIQNKIQGFVKIYFLLP